MTILQVAGEDESWDILNGQVSTDATKRRTAYARCSIQSLNEDGVQIIFRGALKAYLDAQPVNDKDFWFGYRFCGGGGFVSGLIALKLYDSTDKVFARLKSYTPGNLVLETSSLGTFDNLAGDVSTFYPASAFDQAAPSGNPHELTFRIKKHPTQGHIAWYINGAFWFKTPYGDTTGLCVGSPKFLRFGCPNSNSVAHYTEFIATSADQPRVGMNLNTLAPTANGSVSLWTGGYADIGEVTEDTSTLLQAAIDALDSTFVPSAMNPVPGSLVVLAMVLSGKFATVGSAPTQVAGLIKIGANLYPSALQTVAATLELRQFIWETSPATTDRFVADEVDEYGVRSAA